MTPDLVVPALTAVALVAEDAVPLRAAPHDDAPVQLRLARGAWLEPRGEDHGYVKVFDHVHARSGYVRPARLKLHAWGKSQAGAFALLAGFLRDSPDQEGLGIAYASMAMALGPDPPLAAALGEALGTMADRIAQRTAKRSVSPEQNARLDAQIAVAEAWGVRFVTRESEAATRLCYDGEAFRRALGAAADAALRARAALALTRGDCAEEAPAAQRRAWNGWRAEVLAQADPAALPAHLAQRIILRRIEVLADLAFQSARAGDENGARDAAEKLIAAALQVDASQVADEDRAAAEAATIRASAGRWAAEPPSALPRGMALAIPEPGRTCVRFAGAERCTWGAVWPASATVDARGRTAGIVAQSASTVTELWVFRNQGVQVLDPAEGPVSDGFLELAGFTPDGARMLVARGSVTDGRARLDFDTVSLASMRVVQRVHRAGDSRAFRRWVSPRWAASTLAAR